MSSGFFFRELESEPPIATHVALGFPPAAHAAEADLFCRQEAMPGHRQSLIEAAHVGIVGCGGLGSWVAVGLARAGVRQLTLIDGDRFDRTNAARQLMDAQDLGAPKAHALGRYVLRHMTNAGAIHTIARPWDEAHTLLPRPVDLLAVGVDNNAARVSTARYARRHRIPAVFSMLSRDGLRAQVFRQDPDGPCLACVLPNLSPAGAAPCAAANVASCLLAACHAVTMMLAALDGRHGVPPWREASLDGSTERSAYPSTRRGCEGCLQTGG